MKRYEQLSIRKKMHKINMNSIYGLCGASHTSANILSAVRWHTAVRDYATIGLNPRCRPSRVISPVSMSCVHDTPTDMNDLLMYYIPETIQRLCEDYRYKRALIPLRHTAINVSGLPELSVRQLCGPSQYELYQYELYGMSVEE